MVAINGSFNDYYNDDLCPVKFAQNYDYFHYVTKVSFQKITLNEIIIIYKSGSVEGSVLETVPIDLNCKLWR
jgi:hypothetical protein